MSRLLASSSMRGGQRTGFTLIEVLVVVAIIALLVAILLPSLARARALAQAAVCASNVSQLTKGFLMYATANNGRLPAARRPNGADWLGGRNPNKQNPTAPMGRSPEDGTLFRYVGNQKNAYICPASHPPNKLADVGGWYFSYTHHALLSGAKPEVVMGCHIPLDDNGAMGFMRADHTQGPMKALDGAPMVVEEDPVSINYTDDPRYTQDNDGRWISGDCLNDVHGKAGTTTGSGNVGYVDGHCGKLRLPPPQLDYQQRLADSSWQHRYFTAQTLCVRTGRKWVSGMSISVEENEFGFLEGLARPAYAGKIVYPSGRSQTWTPIIHANDPR
jgi:prepilin-type N-terminal cleavage/methylation domain-containing protein/prepilin-type processing-associated H-X9-DG protein